MDTITPALPTILQEVLESKARGSELDLASCMVRTQQENTLDTTKATCHLYHVKLDGNRRPMVLDLIRVAAHSLVDYTIPRSRAEQALQESHVSKSAVPLARLVEEARSLFVTSPLTGEGGELLLFLLAEKVLRLPQLFSKMSLKTSSQHHFNGTDAIHAGVNESGRLALYWGEAKMHSKWQDGIDKAIRGLGTYLRNDDNKCDRDVQLLSTHVDLADPSLEEAICSYLLPSSPHFKQAEYRGIVFVGYDVDSYTTQSDDLTADLVADRIRRGYDQWSAQIKKRLEEEKIGLVTIHLFLLPFPSVAGFRSEFLRAIGAPGVD